jgi:hypothetical protein
MSVTKILVDLISNTNARATVPATVEATVEERRLSAA